ncbi:hypothetical protein ACIB24_00100 [Spongisporangium articulatum]|uniref:Uncharacterized protein n=1 Tax=Spongisporangium articulatum TaxID=3362603 RepID=A0ABW8AHF7_9ACTN
MARASATRYGLAVLAGLAGLTGWLLVSGALSPVIGSVVDRFSSSDQALNLQPVASYSYPLDSEHDWWGDGWMNNDKSQEWSIWRGVPQVGTGSSNGPSKPTLPSRPAIDVPENPKSWLRGGVPTGNAEWKLKPRSSCFQPRGPGNQVQNLTITPGKGTATISWWDIGDPDASTYDVVGVPMGGGGQQTGDPLAEGRKGVAKVITLKAPGTCTKVQTTMTGLQSGQPYVFWLTAATKSRLNNLTYNITRGESDLITVL